MTSEKLLRKEGYRPIENALDGEVRSYAGLSGIGGLYSYRNDASEHAKKLRRRGFLVRIQNKGAHYRLWIKRGRR